MMPDTLMMRSGSLVGHSIQGAELSEVKNLADSPSLAAMLERGVQEKGRSLSYSAPPW